MQASPTKTPRRLLKKWHSSPQVAGKSVDHVSESLPSQQQQPFAQASSDGPVFADTPYTPTPEYNYVQQTTPAPPPIHKTIVNSQHRLANIPELRANDVVSLNPTDGGLLLPKVPTRSPWLLPNIPEPPDDAVSRNTADRFTTVDLELQPLGTPEMPVGVHAVPDSFPGTVTDIPIPIPQTPGDDAPPQTSPWLKPLPSPSMHSQQSIYGAKILNHNPIVSNHRRVVEAIARLRFASQSDDSFQYFHVQNGHLRKLYLFETCILFFVISFF